MEASQIEISKNKCFLHNEWFDMGLSATLGFFFFNCKYLAAIEKESGN